MAILKFRGIYLEDFERLEEKDPDTRYLVLNPDGSVYGEYIGDKLIGTAERIKQLYEENPDTNAFTDAEKAKLAGIEEGAQVNTVNPEDLVADNISFDGSGTNYLVGEANVEGAIKELDTQVKSNADSSAVEISKKLDKETYQAQEVRSRVNFRGGIGTEYITNPGSLVIDTHALFGVNADKYVFAGEYYEGLLPSDGARLATRRYVDKVADKVAENKSSIDDIISGRQTVGKALTAVNLTNQERHAIQDLFSTRITAKYENEIISSIDEETTAVIDEIGGFSVKQLVRNNNFETSSDWEAAGHATNLVIANNEGSYIGSANGWSAMWQVYELPIRNGDKYYVSAEIMPPSDIVSGSPTNLIGFRYTNEGLSGQRSEGIKYWGAKANVWNKISRIITISYYQQGVEPIYFALRTYETAGLVKWRNPVLINLTELGLDHLTVEQVEYLLGNRHYPYGITNTKPSKLISVGENLFDWREFYDALKAVDPNNVEIVNKDGRECIKITNPRVYANAGIKLWQGKFAPNVRYRFSSYHLNEGTDWGASIGAVYTDGTLVGFAGDAYNSTWNQRVKDSRANSTIDYITIAYNSNTQVTYFDINALQLQMLDNPETGFIPYAEKEIELPSAYEDYGMPSLPNGVRDRIFRVGSSPDNSKWFYEKNVEKVILNGSENWIWYGSNVLENCITFSFTIGITHLGGSGGSIISGATIASHTFINASYWERDQEVYNFRNNGNIYFNIKKSRLVGYEDSWTSTEKVNAFKQWLQANPITVYYQLNEPQLTRIDDWNSQYLAYNYGREEIVDGEDNATPIYAVIRYYLDYVKQTETSSEIMGIQQATIQSLQSQLESIEARIKALENKVT